MIYLIKVCIDVTVFYLLYKALFQRLTSFSVNRFYLLASVGLSFGMPLLNINRYFGGTPFLHTLNQFVVQQDAKMKEEVSWLTVIEIGYLVIVALLVIRIVWQLIQLFRMPYSRLKEGSCTVHFIPEHESAFSFFRHVFIPQSEYHSQSLMFQHELVHVKRLHSIDNLLMESVTIALWPFPLMRLMSNELKQVHEYLADEEICRQADKVTYCELLVKQTSRSHPSIAHSFNQPLLKNRVMMITTKKQNQASLWKYLFILPALFITFLFTARTGTAWTRGENASQNDPKPMPEKLPEYKGGQDALMKFLGANIKYPEAAKKQKVEGRVVVRFTVAETGNVEHAKVVKSSQNEEMDAEALRVVNLMPAWDPANDKGKNVACEFMLPISFKLN